MKIPNRGNINKKYIDFDDEDQRKMEKSIKMKESMIKKTTNRITFATRYW